MSRRAGARLLLCCAWLLLPSAAGAEASGVLPLTRVRLYEAGVGYFERSGRLRGGASLPIPATQLDDALKTLVILDDAKDAKLEGVSFDTRVTEQLGRALARLPTDSSAALDLEALARSLTGAEVELQLANGRHRGRLLQVLAAADSGLSRCLPGVPLTPPEKASPCVLQDQPGLILLRDDVELMRVALSD
ncbi:MAG TPA: hypothetical protein VJV78_38940, partial [Polyangiales bacterium]|nr:hypothetical protein [Polyangiales bacterium]